MIKKISSIILFIAMTCTMAIGAAHLAIHMGEVSEETLNVNELFSSVIHAKFSIINSAGQSEYSQFVGSFKGVKLIRQIGSERIVMTDLIVEDTVIDLTAHGFQTNTQYELCIKPYYDFGVHGIRNVAEMSEYNFNNYTIKSSEVDAPISITIIF